MLYEMPTVAQGKLLTTDGEIRVRAFKDNTELVLKPNKVYYSQMPSASPNPSMSIFYGNDNGNLVDWEDNASSVSSNPGIDALEFITPDTTGQYYDLLIPVMGWINCDYFYNYNPDSLTTISFTSNDDDLTNVMKYIYFDDIHSVMQVYGNTSGNVPLSSSVKILCFAQNTSGDMYSYYEEAVVSAGQTVSVTLTQISDADLLALMDTF